MKEKVNEIIESLNKKYAGKKLKVVMREPYYVDEDLGENEKRNRSRVSSRHSPFLRKGKWRRLA